MNIKKYIAISLLPLTLATPLWASTQNAGSQIDDALIDSPFSYGSKSAYAQEYLAAEKALNEKNDPNGLDQPKFKAPEKIYRMLRSYVEEYGRPEALQLIQSTSLLREIFGCVDLNVLKAFKEASLLDNFIRITGTIAACGYPLALEKWHEASKLRYQDYENSNAQELLMNTETQKQFQAFEARTFANPTYTQQLFMLKLNRLVDESQFSGQFGFPKKGTVSQTYQTQKQQEHRITWIQHGLLDVSYDPPLAADERYERDMISKRAELVRSKLKQYYTDCFNWKERPTDALKNLALHALALEGLAKP